MTTLRAKSLVVLYSVLSWTFASSPLVAFEPPPLFSDNLENGAGNWLTYPGATPLEYVSTSTDPNGNHTPEGSFGLELTRPTDRIYHDVDLSSLPGTGVKLSLWFYDVLDTRPTNFEPFDIRNTTSSQVLGLGAFPQSANYQARILTAANGSVGPNWVLTPVPRSLGWHLFEIVQYRGAQAGTVDFYIDGILGHHTTNAFDATLDRIVLGLGFAGSNLQSGYVDDISLVAIPEPSTLLLGAMASAGLLWPMRRTNGRAF